MQSTLAFYRRTVSYFRDDWGKVAASFVLTGGSTVLGVLWPLPVAILIDVVLINQPGKTVDYWPYRVFQQYAPTDRVQQALLLAGLMFAVRISGELLRTVQTLVNIKLGYNGLMKVRCDLFRKLQLLSLSYHKSQPQGDAIYRLSYDTLGFQGVLNTLTGVLVNIVTLAAMAWIMLSMNWKLTLVSLGIMPFLVVVIRHYSRVLKKRYTQSYEVDSLITTSIQRSVASIGLVQAFGRERDEFDNFATTQGNSIAVKMRLHWDEVVYWLILGTIFAIGSCGIMAYGGYLSVRFPTTFAPGMLSAFLIYLEKLYDPLNKLTSTGASIQGSVAQVERVFSVMDRDPVIEDKPGARHLPRQPRVLALRDLSFEYRPNTPVLKHLQAEIKPGEMVAFVGESGVGKTTLLNIIPRFYDPTGGAMTLDGIDARDIKIADLRKHVALVLQDNVVLPTSVRENIAYGAPKATDAQIRQAAELAGASKFIDKLEQGYDTIISESGGNLSGGQKQRISIARALVTEAPIIVLDEPTSALDPQHEQMITQTLDGIRGKRTIVLVSHRLSTVAGCDRIFVMDDGKIVEQGTHDELVARRGLYFKMAKHQMKLEDAPAVIAAQS